MKRSKFSGWTDVFSFTFRQSVKKGGFRAATVLVSLLLMLVVGLLIVVFSKPKEEEKSDIQNVLVVDESGLASDSNMWKMWLGALGMEEYTDTSFETAESEEAALANYAQMSEVPYVIVKITLDESYQLEAIIPENSTISTGESEELLSALVTCFETNKLMMAGLSEEQLVGVMTQTVTDYAKIGEERNLALQMLKIFAPMLVGLVLYMMTILYGQEVGREVSAEKTSKLTEMLLTTVQPYALIAGKVLAVSLAGVLQFGIWIASIFVGLFAGNMIADEMYPGHQNVVRIVIDFVRENMGSTAFSPMAIILAILIFVLGFVFYCVIAGMSGSFVSKPEDVAQTQSIFTFPILISFFVTYFASLAESATVMTVCRYIPFTSPFSVPAEVLTGAISIWEALISFAILIVFSILVVIVSGKIYAGMILYNGQKMSLKKLIGIVTAKKIQSEENK